jgi:hypothetical protein
MKALNIVNKLKTDTNTKKKKMNKKKNVNKKIITLVMSDININKR